MIRRIHGDGALVVLLLVRCSMRSAARAAWAVQIAWAGLDDRGLVGLEIVVVVVGMGCSLAGLGQLLGLVASPESGTEEHGIVVPASKLPNHIHSVPQQQRQL